MKGKFVKTLSLNLIITVSTSIIAFIVNRIFAKHMGVENLGLMRLFTQLVAYLNLAELGLGTASTYALYKPFSEKNNTQISIIISTISAFYKKISYFVIFLGLSCNFILKFIIKNEAIDNTIYLYWSLYVVNVALSYHAAKYSILFTANQEYGYVRKIQGIFRIFFQVSQIFILIYFQSFIFFIIMMILENIFVYIFFKKHYKREYFYIEDKKEREFQIFKDMKNLFWHKIGGVIVFNTDFIIISKYLSLTVVGVYSSYLMIYQIALTLVGILTSVLTPVIGQYIAHNTKEKVYRYWEKLNVLYFMIASIFCIVLYNITNAFVGLWLGNTFELPNFTILLIFINLFIHITRQVLDVVKNNSGFFDNISCPILESLINLIFSLYLVNIMGLNGVIIGTLISNIIVIIIINPIMVFKRCFNKKGVDYIKYLCKYIFILTLTISANNYLISKILSYNKINTWFYFFKFAVSLGIIVTFITFIIFLLDNKLRDVIKNIILSKVDN